MQLTLNGQPVRQRMVAPAELQPASFAPATAEGGAAGAVVPGSAQPPEGMLAELVSWGMLCEGRNELRCARACTRAHPRAPPPRSRPRRTRTSRRAPRTRSVRPLRSVRPPPQVHPSRRRRGAGVALPVARA